MKIKILKVKPSKFTTDEGEDREYFWYDAFNLESVPMKKFQFGCSQGDLQLNEELDLPIYAYDRRDGQVGFKMDAE